MDDGTFNKVKKSSNAMYGPRGILLCGYTKDEQTNLRRAVIMSALTHKGIKFTLDPFTTLVSPRVSYLHR